VLTVTPNATVLPTAPSRAVYLSLGSNLGDRAANLRAAIAALPAVGAVVSQVSSLYETEPVDFLDQPWFLNCVVEGETDLEPLALLESLHSIEARMGGKKEFAKGPRLIDLDILLYGSETINTPELQVPHPRMLLRRFVLTPLAELAPGLKHPSWDATAAQLLAQSADKSTVRTFLSR
jgi:2-amino-4-hydroxy-6-hydroxymethyldihydropteridine diphosphokinase